MTTAWPEKRRILGTRVQRLDGPAKSTGRAKYSSDLNPKDLLFAVYNTSPYAHARVTSIDTSEAEKMKGVAAVHVAAPAGTEIQWEGTEIAAVAATTEEIARDAARKIKVEYEVLPHLVKEDDLSKAGKNAVAGGEEVQGDPDKAFQEADGVHEGFYSIPVVTHCCLEPHGAILQWQGDTVMAWPSTQDVTNWNNGLTQNLKVPATNIKVKMDYIGGGFGSKFGPDAWGEVAARLGITLDNAHRASDDADAALRVLLALGRDVRVPRAYGALVQEQRRLAMAQADERRLKWR